MTNSPKIALVHDWLVSMRGGEKVLEAFCELFPESPLFTLVHRKGSVSGVIENRTIRTSFIQRLPFGKKYYQHFLPLYPAAIGGFKLRDYDLVISSSHAAAKGVKVRKDALHICYCYTPMRYIWDQYGQYFGRGRASIVTRLGMKFFIDYLRRWDVSSAAGVNRFIAISRTTQERIKRIYGRTSSVIYPPVDVERFSVSAKDDGYYLVVSALVPYKRVDIAVEAFNELGERLVIIGTGSEEKKLKARAKRNVEFLGWADDNDVKKYYEGCRALIFPGEEDFGIVPVEAMACGKPVVAFASGGATETVIDSETGILFRPQTAGSLLQALRKLSGTSYDPSEIRKYSVRFGKENFKKSVREFVGTAWENHYGDGISVP